MRGFSYYFECVNDTIKDIKNLKNLTKKFSDFWEKSCKKSCTYLPWSLKNWLSKGLKNKLAIELLSFNLTPGPKNLR